MDGGRGSGKWTVDEGRENGWWTRVGVEENFETIFEEIRGIFVFGEQKKVIELSR